jgi:hypothetical protein
VTQAETKTTSPTVVTRQGECPDSVEHPVTRCEVCDWAIVWYERGSLEGGYVHRASGNRYEHLPTPHAAKPVAGRAEYTVPIAVAELHRFTSLVEQAGRLEQENATLRLALRKACDAGWADGESAMRSYLADAENVLAAPTPDGGGKP